LTANDGAAISRERRCPTELGLSGSKMSATRATSGAISLSASSNLATGENSNVVNPVTLHLAAPSSRQIASQPDRTLRRKRSRCYRAAAARLLNPARYSPGSHLASLLPTQLHRLAKDQGWQLPSGHRSRRCGFRPSPTLGGPAERLRREPALPDRLQHTQ
jgi:hypothetical protein